jgi:DNA-binding MarR family transcriptional regulator
MKINEIIHQSLRLKIMTALCAGESREPWEFSRLKKVAEATDGNLGNHLGILEQAGYVSIRKDFIGKKPRTRISVTKEGLRAFHDHISYLREIVASVKL